MRRALGLTSGDFFALIGTFIKACVRQKMELSELPIPKEEYPFIAFGVSWLTGYVLNTPYGSKLGRPNYTSVAGAEYDLVHLWHKSIKHFPGLENRARIKLLQLSKETKCFDREAIAEFSDGESQIDPNSDNKWKFRVSRIGIDVGSKQAIGHFFVTLDGGWWNWGFILVMEWDDDDVIRLKTIRGTVSPGK